MTRRLRWILGVGLFGGARLGAAAEPATPELTQMQLDSWLYAEVGEADTILSSAELDAPPSPPRRHGLVIEGSVGALGHLGDMRAVSPVSPWFKLQVGYEPFDWLMLFGSGDVALSSTAIADRPSENRSYALFGVGAGARLAWQPLTDVGFYLQSAAGLASVNRDVLSTYGYLDADRLRPFAEGLLGVEWFQVSSHYGLSLYGGARDYFRNFERIRGARPPIVWLSGVAIRYVL